MPIHIHQGLTIILGHSTTPPFLVIFSLFSVKLLKNFLFYFIFKKKYTYYTNFDNLLNA